MVEQTCSWIYSSSALSFHASKAREFKFQKVQRLTIWMPLAFWVMQGKHLLYFFPCFSLERYIKIPDLKCRRVSHNPAYVLSHLPLVESSWKSSAHMQKGFFPILFSWHFLGQWVSVLKINKVFQQTFHSALYVQKTREEKGAWAMQLLLNWWWL